ncbi:MAG: HNH endonuclease [Mycobacterium leprae]
MSCLEQLLVAAEVTALDPIGKAIPGYVVCNKARDMVREGRAVIRGPNRIQLLNFRLNFLQYIRERDGYICRYCGRRGATVDHVVPQCRGGRSTPGNCVCACQECNHRKDCMTLQQFRAHIHGLPCECHTDSNWVRHLCYRHQVEAHMAYWPLPIGLGASPADLVEITG